MGMDAYLPKPIRAGDLLDLFRALRPEGHALSDTELHTDTGSTYPV